MKLLLLPLGLVLGTAVVFGHTGAEVMDRESLRTHLLQEWREKQGGEKKPLQLASAGTVAALGAAVANVAKAPAAAQPFLAFPKLELKWDQDFLHVGSNGWPDHPMMVGITAWQQQVPLPQTYFGANAWRIPLKPVVAEKPAMIEGRFLRGAIALAVNGVPIFNPQNNRGEISAEIGELDQWGGHCGRADDYHYHAAPLHLQPVVGKGMPIAYALDGYPIYGLTEPDGSPVGKLDQCHGHESAGVGYHYHAAVKRPYVMAGFHGEVAEVEGQVDPQPRAQGVREALTPLRGAEITGFESTGANGYRLSYTVNGEKRSVAYSVNADGTYPFEYDNGREGKTKEIYTVRRGGGGGGGEGGPKGKGKGRRPEGGPPPRPGNERPAAGNVMDRNGDGVVSAVEFAEEAKRAFERSGGGSLAAAMEKARGEFQARDRNQDGRLEGAELEAPRALVTTGAGQPRSSNGTFLLSSSVVEDGAEMPVEFTGDGSGATLPLEWKGAPVGTKSYALIMDHMAPDGEMKWYWTLYGVPASVTSLAKNVEGVGQVGTGFKGHVGYEPPRSKGPGAKTYVLTVYALAEELQIRQAPSEVNREVLLAAMQGKVLASSALRVVHTSGGGTESREPPPRPPERAKGKGKGKGGAQGGLIKPSLEDTMKLNVYADNWFILYINGRLVAVDPIQFTPHNGVSVDFLPEYPMTIAVLAKDNADPKSGLEYGSSIGDGGFVLKFGDGTVTNATWKAKSFFHGPMNGDTARPQVKQEPLPANWWAVEFDDSGWSQAKEYSVEEVDPKQPYFESDFADAKFIWSDDLALDNTVIFRTKVEKPGWTQRWNTKPDLDVTGAPQR